MRLSNVTDAHNIYPRAGAMFAALAGVESGAKLRLATLAGTKYSDVGAQAFAEHHRSGKILDEKTQGNV